MNPKTYERIKAVANDERTDPRTRDAAQRQIDKWKGLFESQPATAPEKKRHPGMETSVDYQTWVKGLNIGAKR